MVLGVSRCLVLLFDSESQKQMAISTTRNRKVSVVGSIVFKTEYTRTQNQKQLLKLKRNYYSEIFHFFEFDRLYRIQ